MLDESSENILGCDLFAVVRQRHGSIGIKYNVAEALMWTKYVVVVDIFVDQALKMLLAEDDEVIQALVFERLHPPALFKKIDAL